MKWTKQNVNMYTLIRIFTLVSIVFLMGCPKIGGSDDSIRDNVETLSDSFGNVDIVSKSTMALADKVSEAVQELLTDSTSESKLITFATKLHDNTKEMRDGVVKTKDAAEKVSNATAKKNDPRSQAAKAVFEVATKASEKADVAYDAAKIVQNDVEKNQTRNDEKIQEVVQAVAQTKTMLQNVQVVNKIVEAIQEDTTTQTIVLISEHARQTEKGVYKVAMKVGGTEAFLLEDVGIGTGNLSAQYKSEGSTANGKFTVISSDRTISFEPKNAEDAPGVGTYIYTISKPGQDDVKAEDVTITITVEAQQETILLDKGFFQMEVGETAPIEITDSGVGGEPLSGTYKRTGRAEKFDVTPSGRTITFTPKSGAEAPGAGTYIYKIGKTKSGQNIEAKEVIVVIEVLRKIKQKTEKIELNKATHAMKFGDTKRIIVTDGGRGTKKLNAVYKAAGSTGSGDTFNVTKRRRRIIFKPKRGNEAPGAGIYIYTISKPKTRRKNTKAEDVEVTITVLKAEGTIDIEKARGNRRLEVIGGSGNARTLSLAADSQPYAITVRGEGGAVTIGKSGDATDAEVTAVLSGNGNTLTITPKAYNAAKTTRTITIKRAGNTNYEPAQDMVLKVTITAVLQSSTFSLSGASTQGVVDVQGKTTESGNFSATMSGAEAQAFTSTNANTNKIVLTDTGTGEGALSVTQVIKDGGDVLSTHFDVTPNGRALTITGKQNQALAAGTYAFTIEKAATASHNKATLVFTLVVQGLLQETIALDDTTPSMTLRDTAPIVVSDSGIGTGDLRATYKALGSDGDKFEVTFSGQEITFTPKSGANAPGAGTYIYTISKVATGENRQAADVEVTITVQKGQGTIDIQKATGNRRLEVIGGSGNARTLSLMADSQPYAITVRGEGGTVTIEKSGYATDAEVTAVLTGNGNTLTITPKAYNAAKTTRTITIKRAGNANYEPAQDVQLAITITAKPVSTFSLSGANTQEVVDVQGKTTESGNFSATMSGAEAQAFTSTNANTNKIVLTDTGTEGDGALSVTQVIKDGGDVLSTHFDVTPNGRALTITAKEDEALAAGTYAFTIEKAATASHGKATLVFTLVVQELLQETIVLDDTTPSMTLGDTAPIVVSDSGIGTGDLRATYKALGSDGDKFTFTADAVARTITFTPKSGAEVPDAGTYIYTISKVATGENRQAADVEVTITVQKGQGTIDIEKARGNRRLEVIGGSGNARTLSLIADSQPYAITVSGEGGAVTIGKSGDATDAEVTAVLIGNGNTLTITPKAYNAAKTTRTITIKRAGNANYEPAQDVQLTITITAKPVSTFSLSGASTQRVVDIRGKTTESGNFSATMSGAEAQAFTRANTETNKIVFEDTGTEGDGALSLTKVIKDGIGNDVRDTYFVFEPDRRTLTITATQDQALAAGTYAFTIEKAATASHAKATLVFTLVVQEVPLATFKLSGARTKGVKNVKRRKHISSDFTAYMKKLESRRFTLSNANTNRIVLTDSSTKGVGALSVTKVIKDGIGNDVKDTYFAFASNGRTLTITGKRNRALAVGSYAFTIQKAASAGYPSNTLTFTLIVNSLPSSEFSISSVGTRGVADLLNKSGITDDFSATMTGAEAKAFIIRKGRKKIQQNNEIVFTDSSSAGTGGLYLQKVTKDGRNVAKHAHFTIKKTKGALRTLTIRGKQKSLKAGIYVFTIVKARTANQYARATLAFTLTVQ